jgi:hypothetical protein
MFLQTRKLRLSAFLRSHNTSASLDGFRSQPTLKWASPELRQEAAASLGSMLQVAEIEQKNKNLSSKNAAKLLTRIYSTMEVSLSKLLPGGFGWQAGSALAAATGLAATDPFFWLATGLGDALGVMSGHMAWMTGKKAVTKCSEINLEKEGHTAALLGTAVVFSGTAWQPLVNFFHGNAGLQFIPTASSVGLLCALLFFGGLRVGRSLWGSSGILTHVDPNSYVNLKADAGLALSCGGASACFVGTDVSFGEGATDTNFLRPVIGVEASTDALTGCIKAGSSTALGFAAAQSVQNATLPAGKNWID